MTRKEQLEAEFKKIDGPFNRRLFLVLGVALMLSLLLQPHEMTGIAETIVGVGTLGAMALFMVHGCWMLNRQKREAAIKLGIECQSCGKVPWPLEAVKAAESETCPTCGEQFRSRNLVEEQAGVENHAGA